MGTGTIFSRAINEVMDEMALQRRVFGKAAPAAPAAETTPKQEPKNARVSIGKVDSAREVINGQEKEVVVIKLNRVFNVDAQQIADAINSSCPSDIVKAEAFPGGQYRVVLSIVPDESRLNDHVYDAICDAISSTGHYIPGAVRLVRNMLPDEVKNTALGSDIEAAEARIGKNWKEMLQKLQDPEVRTRLLSYQMTDAYASAYGHVLSPENVTHIRAQFPSASFVCERSTWERYFNREVMPGATPINVVQPDFVDDKYLDDAARALHYNSFADAMAKTDWSTQVHNQIRIVAVNMKGTKLTFHTVKMYDVSETIPPANPADDVWTNKIGLSDNITGALNQKAQEYDASITDPEELQKRKENKEKVENRNSEQHEHENQAWAIDRVLAAEKVYMTPYEDLRNNGKYATYIQCGAFEYAKKVLPNGYGVMQMSKSDAQRAGWLGKDAPAHVDKIAKLVAMAVAVSCGINEFDPRFCVSDEDNRSITEKDGHIAFQVASKLLSAVVKHKRPSGIKKMKIGKQQPNNESINRMTRKGRMDENGERTMTTGQFLSLAQRYFGPGSSLYIGDDAVQDEGAGTEQENMAMESRLRKIISEEIAKIVGKGER